MYSTNSMRKECIAMLLAGGQGSRLLALTKKTAKPAVPFGGKYRIIDFPLSNCVNSGIDTVGIMTQYQPLELNDYIGNGTPWGLNRSFGGVHILPPYSKSGKSEWYKGTANALPEDPICGQYNPNVRACAVGRPHLQDGTTQKCWNSTRRTLRVHHCGARCAD